MRRWIGTAFLGLGVAACNGPQRVAPAPAASQELRAPAWTKGQRQSFRAVLTTGTQLGGDANKDVTLELKGLLDVSVVEVSGKQVDLALSMQQPSLTSKDGTQDAQLAVIMKDLQQPAWFQLVDGVVTREGFARDLSPPAVSALRGLAAALQYPQVLPSKGLTVAEIDGTGHYTARYTGSAAAGGTTLSKTKLSCDDLLLSGQIGSVDRLKLLPKVVRSAYRLSFAGAGLLAVTGDEELESELMGAKLHSRTQLSLERVKVEPGPALDSAALQAAVVEVSPKTAYGVRPQRAEFDALRWDGRSFQQLLSDMEAQAQRQRPEELAASSNGELRSPSEQAEAKAKLGSELKTFSSLVALMRQKPETLEQARKAVLAGSPAATTLVDAMGSAGTPAAQEQLAELLAGKLPRKVVGAAATSLIRVEQPTPRTLQLLERLTTDPVLADFGVFGLGIASRNFRRGGDVASADRLAELLVRGLRAAPEKLDRIRYLRGLANAAAPQSIDAVKPLLADDDEAIRSAALEALRLVAEPAVEPLTANAMLHDKRSSVRAAALRVAAARGPSEGLEVAVGKCSLDDADPAVRQQAVELLARWLPQRGALRARLQDVVSKEAQPRIRDVAVAALKKAG